MVVVWHSLVEEARVEWQPVLFGRRHYPPLDDLEVEDWVVYPKKEKKTSWRGAIQTGKTMEQRRRIGLVVVVVTTTVPLLLESWRNDECDDDHSDEVGCCLVSRPRLGHPIS